MQKAERFQEVPPSRIEHEAIVAPARSVVIRNTVDNLNKRSRKKTQDLWFKKIAASGTVYEDPDGRKQKLQYGNEAVRVTARNERARRRFWREMKLQSQKEPQKET